jgi:hypothetical protein
MFEHEVDTQCKNLKLDHWLNNHCHGNLKINVGGVCLSFVNLYRETGLKFLGDVASKQVFKPWELSDNIPRLKYELSTVSPFAKLMDLLHRAAYRRGLGNSLFCPNHLVGSHNSETVSKYRVICHRNIN